MAWQLKHEKKKIIFEVQTKKVRAASDTSVIINHKGINYNDLYSCSPQLKVANSDPP